MSENVMNESKFTMNEYMEVEVNQKQLELCKDCYRALGWIIASTNSGIGKATMRLQRDRKIKNHEQLGTLQRNCEEAFKSIEQLEESKTTKAMAVSLGTGIVGTVFMGCAVFAYLAGKIELHVFLAIPGFIGWGLPYFLYKNIKKKSSAKIEPMIAHNYDMIYESCEKATSLIN